MYILLGLYITFLLTYEQVPVTAISDHGTLDTSLCLKGLTKLHKENADLRRRLESLESKSNNAAICEKETETNDREQKLNSEIKELCERLEHIEYKFDDQNLVSRDIGDETPTLAFSARLKEHMADIGNGQTIIFHIVDTNIGGRYNNQTGIFYCDKPGLYYFSINAMVHGGKYVELSLVINGNDKCRALADARGLSDFDTGSNSGVYKLQKGDSVWVRVGYHLAGDTGNIIYYGFRSFTGFLLSDVF